MARTEFSADLIRRTMCYLTVRDIQETRQVSRRWKRLSDSNFVWESQYRHRFPNCSEEQITRQRPQIKNGFITRLNHPEEGDSIQVMWKGAFNLVYDEIGTVYSGRAWWQANVVEELDNNERMVSFNSWDDPRWNIKLTNDTEWRWNAPYEGKEPYSEYSVGDKVELLALSSSKGPTFVETTIVDTVFDSNTQQQYYDVGEVIVGATPLVTADRLRMIAPAPKRLFSSRRWVANRQRRRRRAQSRRLSNMSSAGMNDNGSDRSLGSANSNSSSESSITEQVNPLITARFRMNTPPELDPPTTPITGVPDSPILPRLQTRIEQQSRCTGFDNCGCGSDGCGYRSSSNSFVKRSFSRFRGLMKRFLSC
eukprot:TRINITY_DN249012_c0_g1_i1.p1 TRINITY_DN249012_c0_g1~~TRINITY_DN249012_c0_g1_i1.p1  ORF type:complete len:395 (+),score=85.91 TRINITY_DN249012_c0_g1_i1:90-1187(+)